MSRRWDALSALLKPSGSGMQAQTNSYAGLSRLKPATRARRPSALILVPVLRFRNKTLRDRSAIRMRLHHTRANALEQG